MLFALLTKRVAFPADKPEETVMAIPATSFVSWSGPILLNVLMELLAPVAASKDVVDALNDGVVLIGTGKDKAL